MTFTKHPLFCVLTLLPMANAMALTNDVNVNLRADFKFTDNARRQEVDPIDEWQNQYEAAIAGNYTNEWAVLNADYNVTEHTFEKSTQPDRSFLEGEADLNLGSPYQPYSLGLSHSRRALYNSPDTVELVSNRDEREILSAHPMARWKLNDADRLILSANFSDVSYRMDETKNSTIKGASLAWELGLSKADTLVFLAQQNEISFDSAPDVNYKRQSVSGRYAVKLRELDYSISLGVNRVLTETGDGEIVRPSFDILASYVDGYDTFRFVASRKITDTSMGNGNQMGVGAGASPAGGEGVDIIDYSNVELTWATTVVCERCRVNLSAFGIKQDYQKTPQSHTERGAGAGFDYHFSKALVADVQLSRSKRVFEPGSDHIDYEMTRASVELSYRFQNDLEVKLYREQQKRDADAFTDTYNEHITGLALSYVF